MWTISSLKERGKAAFKANYWPCVLVALILTAMTGVSAGRSGGQAYDNVQQFSTTMQSFGETMYSAPPVTVNVNVNPVAVVGGGIVMILITLLVFSPLQVGCFSFFKKNSEFGPEKIDELKTGFVPSWGRNVLSMFLAGLFVALWMLLFIIPGIVKSYSYRLVPYILADDPDIDAVEAITLSRTMMKGHKWDAFVLDLSFIGWFLLSICTIGILQIFYVGPYKAATDAEFYLAMRAEYTQQYMQ